MRTRMLREQAHHDAERFDLKKDAGGMTDIEFLAQYWALKWAGTHPPVAMYSDTLRQLESVASANLVPQADIDVLGQAYRRYREILHHRSLEEGDSLVPAAELQHERAAVSALWQQAMQL
jgi:glutamate-ammonia-ligase adenylyltransferase